MNRIIALAAGVMLVAALAVSAWAQPSLHPWTGTGNLPTAELAKPGSITLAQDLVRDDSEFVDNDEDLMVTRLVLGINDRLEMGVSYGDEYSESLGLAAKYQIKSDESGSIAVGALYSSTAPYEIYYGGWYEDYFSVAREKAFQVYAARTFPIGKPQAGGVALRATVGANWTRLRYNYDQYAFGSDSDGFRLFASWQAEYGRGSLAVDYQSTEDSLDQSPMWSAVVRYDASSRLKLQMGYGNAYGFRGADGSRFFSGICYTVTR